MTHRKTIVHNDNCDGSGSCVLGEVRVLPLSKDPYGSNLILCQACFQKEIEYRQWRNQELSPESRFDLPQWEELAVYPKEF